MNGGNMFHIWVKFFKTQSMSFYTHNTLTHHLDMPFDGGWLHLPRFLNEDKLEQDLPFKNTQIRWWWIQKSTQGIELYRT